MQRGEMIVLAARTSVGKSALALDIATHNARNGNRVLYFSLEMMEHSVGTRFASRETGLDSESIESGILNPSQRRAIEDAKDLISGWPLTVVTQSSLSVGQIGAYSRAHAARHGLDLIIIDHAGLVKSSERSAYERATEIATDIQRLAMAVKVPVLACYQINRAGEGQMPTLADLRDSGAIEENAHKIWLLHRERGKAESFFRVAKYRNGQVGDVADGLLVFDPSRASYRDAFHAFASDFQ
jgi:replicative DNA helicase